MRSRGCLGAAEPEEPMGSQKMVMDVCKQPVRERCDHHGSNLHTPNRCCWCSPARWLERWPVVCIAECELNRLPKREWDRPRSERLSPSPLAPRQPGRRDPELGCDDDPEVSWQRALHTARTPPVRLAIALVFRTGPERTTVMAPTQSRGARRRDGETDRPAPGWPTHAYGDRSRTGLPPMLLLPVVFNFRRYVYIARRSSFPTGMSLSHHRWSDSQPGTRSNPRSTIVCRWPSAKKIHWKAGPSSANLLGFWSHGGEHGDVHRPTMGIVLAWEHCYARHLSGCCYIDAQP